MRCNKIGVAVIVVGAATHLLTTVRWHRSNLAEIWYQNINGHPYGNHLYGARPMISDREPPTSRFVRRYGDPSLQKPLRFHPHAGAVDEFGHYGYVHDPTVLLKKTNYTYLSSSPAVEQSQLCAPLGYGLEGGADVGRRLFEKISASPPNISHTDSLKVFCGIYTHPGKMTKLQQ